MQGAAMQAAVPRRSPAFDRLTSHGAQILERARDLEVMAVRLNSRLCGPKPAAEGAPPKPVAPPGFVGTHSDTLEQIEEALARTHGVLSELLQEAGEES